MSIEDLTIPQKYSNLSVGLARLFNLRLKEEILRRTMVNSSALYVLNDQSQSPADNIQQREDVVKTISKQQDEIFTRDAIEGKAGGKYLVVYKERCITVHTYSSRGGKGSRARMGNIFRVGCGKENKVFYDLNLEFITNRGDARTEGLGKNPYLQKKLTPPERMISQPEGDVKKTKEALFPLVAQRPGTESTGGKASNYNISKDNKNVNIKR